MNEVPYCDSCYHPIVDGERHIVEGRKRFHNEACENLYYATHGRTPTTSPEAEAKIIRLPERRV